MFRKILVPLDGSPFAEFAIPRALELAERSGGIVHVVTVAEVREEGPVRRGRAGGGVDRAELVRRAEAYLDQVGGRITTRTSGVEVTGQVLPGTNTVSAIVHEMAAEEIDLVVMTTHGRGPLRRAWLGSVADGVVRHASRPVLLLRPEADGNGDPAGRPIEAEAAAFRRILVPLDGSLDADEALPHAREMARAEGSRVLLLTVLSPGGGGAYPFLAVPAHEGNGGDDAMAQESARLEELAEGLRGEGVPVEVDLLRKDRPALAILEAVEREEIDLVVMTTRGRGGVARLALGSVADKVIRGAEVPVLVHRPRRREED